MVCVMTNSQSYQDLFALQVCKNKTYIEIGANRPKKRNNTFLLEQNGFKGFSIEYSKKWQISWKNSKRSNVIYFADAMKFDYATAIKTLGLSNKFGYLSCDIEPNTATFKALQHVIDSDIQFECITFEHDLYASKKDIREKVDRYLIKKGYRIAVSDVYLPPDKTKLYETWYVKNNIEFETCRFENFIKTIKQS
jgi:hypothetical protein